MQVYKKKQLNNKKDFSKEAKLKNQHFYCIKLLSTGQLGYAKKTRGVLKWDMHKKKK